MAFQDLPGSTIRSRLENPLDTIGVGLYKGNVLALRIGLNVATKLGWKKGDAVALAEGFGADAGIIQLRAIDSRSEGYHLTSDGPKGNCLRLAVPFARFKHHALLRVDEMIPSEPALQSTFGSTLTVMLPDWVRPFVATTPAQDPA